MTEPAGPEQVAAWWRRWPDANLGVVTGVVSGVVVLDVDPRNGGDVSLADLQVAWGRLAPTVESATGGGGRHLWFAVSHPVPSAVLAEGLELKGEGGMVVVPPSLHASGGVYRWVPGRRPGVTEMEAVPAWLEALARGMAPPSHGGPVAAAPPVRTDLEQHAFAEAWQRAGVILSGDDAYYLCPFHPDHRPSLHIDGTGCRWYCFGCRRGGGMAALADLLGEAHPARPRRRMRGRVGSRRPISLHGDVRVPVVGESHHQDALLGLIGGARPYGGVEVETVAELVPLGPDEVEVRIGGSAVGRLRREEAVELSGEIDEARDTCGAATCRALVRGGWDRGRDDVGMLGVTLLLPRASADEEPRLFAV